MVAPTKSKEIARYTVVTTDDDRRIWFGRGNDGDRMAHILSVNAERYAVGTELVILEPEPHTKI